MTWIRRGSTLAACCVLWGSGGGCIYDPDDRCGPGEEPNRLGYCVCKAGHEAIERDINVFVDDPEGDVGRLGCRPCGENEVVEAQTCVCEPGFVVGGAGTCVVAAVPDVSFGAACTADTDCTGEGAVCIDDDAYGADARAAYCSTRGCNDASTCPVQDGFGCFDTGAGTLCRKPPAGEGDPCDMNEGVMSNPACTAEATGCAFGRCTAPFVCGSDADCTPGLICCDVSAFVAGVVICTTAEACPSD